MGANVSLFLGAELAKKVCYNAFVDISMLCILKEMTSG